MRKQTIDITHNLYDQIIRLKKDKSVEQFLSELIFRYSDEVKMSNKPIIKANSNSEVLSIKDKFEFINNDQNLSKFRFQKD
jgi:predicted CopG family antitoxin